ncbi:recombinase family protein [Sphingobium sp. AR-3-1]|uniref:Recombinase family protein n=1 Tax=Sphingobium psychrophilum TaxID=2728834 RepID=A0A7X9ZTK5_9SPHN|nr:recombinase family protein [Sphingobium psychrophilum]NML10676.1 recombinase family protein [Sphingobium psychrophilum]
MTRIALYARYSSDQQSAASIEDQLRICRERAEREGWHVVHSYQDAAISGASMILRPGIQSLLQDAQAGKFDIVIAEALDRVSRDQADVATLYKHLQFARVPLVTLAEGEISELHVGLKGTMNALFLKDLAKKTHRGQRGRVEKGFSAGPVGYGYRNVRRLSSEGELVRGECKIEPLEGSVVNRIFREFAAGKSPRAIARDLNAEGVAGPAGRAWSDTTMIGKRCQGVGILNNELYAGLRVWNHKHYLKDPRTGGRISRTNPESEWIRVEMPQLRIVSDDLWQAVKDRQDALAVRYKSTIDGVHATQASRMHLARRPVHLLSGLIECGLCGGKIGVAVNGRYGCLNHHRRHICANNRTILREKLEQRALSGLAERLVSPDKVQAAVAAYAEYINRENREQRAQMEVDARALEKVERAIGGIMAAIEDGLYQPAMKARMDELERQKADIAARMAQAPQAIPDVHPGIAEIYKRQMDRFTQALEDPETRLDASEAIRSLIDRIVLHPGEKRGEIHATLQGALMGILEFVQDNPRPVAAVTTKAASGSRERVG